ncbi:hypothetical protein NP569_27060, partial [Vibrio parahaemolyticus]|nr:hypothetical protein [Vibrio parahaemolyticus]
TVFQQEDTDPTLTLVTKLMLDGGTGAELNKATGKIEQVTYPGVLNRNRNLGEFPKGYKDLIHYVTVDPAVGGKSPRSDWA